MLSLPLGSWTRWSQVVPSKLNDSVIMLALYSNIKHYIKADIAENLSLNM